MVVQFSQTQFNADLLFPEACFFFSSFISHCSLSRVGKKMTFSLFLDDIYFCLYFRFTDGVNGSRMKQND